MSNAQSRASKLQAILQRLASGTPDVTGAALVSDDGLIIASALPADTEEDSVGGMSSALQSLGSRVAAELRLGEMEQVLLRAASGSALMVGAGDGGVLLVLMTPKAKLGLIFLDVKRAAAELVAAM